MLQIGDPAPDFELLSDENQPIRLSDPVSYTHLTLPTNREV